MISRLTILIGPGKGTVIGNYKRVPSRNEPRSGRNTIGDRTPSLLSYVLSYILQDLIRSELHISVPNEFSIRIIFIWKRLTNRIPNGLVIHNSYVHARYLISNMFLKLIV